MLGVLSVSAPAQTEPSAEAGTPEGDRGFHLNRPVDDPESLSGVWEAPDNNSGAVGIHLRLGTTVSGDADPPVWIPQLWQFLEVGIFQRRGAEFVFGEEDFFSDSPRGGVVTLENEHLQLHFAAVIKTDLSIDL